MPEARVGQRRETPAVGRHLVGDGRKLASRDEVLPGLRHEERRVGQADRDVGGVLVQEGQVFLETVTVQPVG